MNSKKPLNGPSLEYSKNPDKLVILLHGYGDTGENFINIANYLYETSAPINFYSPNAPTKINNFSNGLEWFNLYPNGINFNDAGKAEIEILKQDCISSLSLIKNYINEKCNKFSLTYNDCFLIGFSQGAMMSYMLGELINQKFAGCAIISGRILNFINSEKNLFINTPIFISHGDRDTVLKLDYFLMYS